MTDWNLIRKMMNAAIDACETVENCGVSEENRPNTFEDGNGNQSPTLWEYLQSACTYPDNLTSSVIRARNKLNDDKPYTNELSRTLINVGRLSAELVGAKKLSTKVSGVDPFSNDEASINEMIEDLATWYKGHFSEGIRKIMKKEG